jgi:lipopolysaccharide/colanic/teichoic acid biosynthesis glycosyltransferase
MLKRLFDIVFSILGLLLFGPLLIVIAVWVKLDSPGPVLFLQKRVGKDETPFLIRKFRTMVVNADKMGKQITVGRDPRITRSGAFLRKYKLDELPQLFNVLVGEMSFVGPRPEVPYYVQFYTLEQKMVLTVRPGITDYASIKYRDENHLLAEATDPEKVYIEQIMQDKLRLNMEYIERASIVEDLRIILLTIWKVVA